MIAVMFHQDMYVTRCYKTKILTGSSTNFVGNFDGSSFHVNDFSTYVQNSEGSQIIIERSYKLKEKRSSVQGGSVYSYLSLTIS